MKPDVLRPMLNSNVALDCKVSGHPIESVYWLHDGRSLQPHERLQISDDGFRVHITKCQKEDEGIYQCFASNSKDQAYGVAEITLEGKVLPGINIEIILQNSNVTNSRRLLVNGLRWRDDPFS